jgi:phosphopantetheine--protein transferase-like protein
MALAGSMQARLGVDLIELKRAKLFYHRHKSRLASLLTEKEISYVGNRSNAYRKLAEVLAVKEAAFKTLGRALTGPAAFASLSVLPPAKGRPYFGVEKKKSKKNALKIRLIKKNKKFVVAQCVGI